VCGYIPPPAPQAAEGSELLSHVLAAGSMNEERARHVFRQMLSGVREMHGRGVAHCDLKLENAVFDARGTLRWCAMYE